MLSDLMKAGRELAGYTDVRVKRGLAWATAEAVLAALPLGLVYLLLLEMLHATVSLSKTLLIAGGMLLCLIGRMVCSMRAMPAIFSGAYAMMGQARLRIADHLRRLPMGWFAAQRSGSLAATLAADLQVIEDIWAHFLGVFFGGLLVPVFLSIFLFWLDWRLALVVVSTLPCAFALLMLGQRLIIVQSGKLQAANAQGQAEMLDYVQGIAVIRAFETGSHADLTFTRLRTALAGMRRRAVAIELWPAPLIALFGFALEAGFALVVWFGVQRLGRPSALEGLPGETLLLFAVLSLPVYQQLFEVGRSFVLLRYAQQAMLRIRELLALQTLPEPVVPDEPTGTDIVLDQLCFGYAGSEGEMVLTSIDAVIPARSLTAIVGHSGSGKTTLLHLIARLWDVNQGAILIGGVDVREIGTEVLHRHIAMVFQDVVLFSGTVLDNLRVGKHDATREQIVEAARLAEAHDFIQRLPQGYDTPVGENGAKLSGGERQRISIARAFLKNAPILLLDEATASVDPSGAAHIQRALSALVKDRTVVVIAHRLRTVRHADRILVLDRGKLVEQGRHEELLALEGQYASLWKFQTQAGQWRVAEFRP